MKALTSRWRGMIVIAGALALLAGGALQLRGGHTSGEYLRSFYGGEEVCEDTACCTVQNGDTVMCNHEVGCCGGPVPLCDEPNC